jgi:hypothetical protein
LNRFKADFENVANFKNSINDIKTRNIIFENTDHFDQMGDNSENDNDSEVIKFKSLGDKGLALSPKNEK